MDSKTTPQRHNTILKLRAWDGSDAARDFPFRAECSTCDWASHWCAELDEAQAASAEHCTHPVVAVCAVA